MRRHQRGRTDGRNATLFRSSSATARTVIASLCPAINSTDPTCSPRRLRVCRDRFLQQRRRSAVFENDQRVAEVGGAVGGKADQAVQRVAQFDIPRHIQHRAAGPERGVPGGKPVLRRLDGPASDAGGANRRACGSTPSDFRTERPSPAIRWQAMTVARVHRCARPCRRRRHDRRAGCRMRPIHPIRRESKTSPAGRRGCRTRRHSSASSGTASIR